MVCSPWLLTTLWYRESLWKSVKALEYELCWDVTFVFRQYLLTELLFEITTDNENNLTEACLNSIVNRIIHDGFTVWTQTVQLFQTSVTAAHTSSEEQ